MGAAGAHRAIEILRRHGHDPRELERYATCNKIWLTKIKRLRMPDLFCLHCGQRFEVRAKTKLEIKMSDSPTVAGRQWDAGLREEDIVLFVRCEADPPVPAAHIEGFEVGQLRATVASSRLGPPKSAGEGAERDRKWPAIVPTASGEVIEVSPEGLVVRLDSGRRQTLRLRGRRNGDSLTPYATAGHRFLELDEILAGAPSRRADLACPGDMWEPSNDIASAEVMSRFAAAKAIGLRSSARHREQLEELARSDPDPRLRLEAIGALMRLGDESAGADLIQFFEQPPREDLRMEAVLLAGEIRNEVARRALHSMLQHPSGAEHEELRAAIVWSLGAYGHGDLEAVVPHLGDASDLVAGHAAVAMGKHLTAGLRDRLLAILRGSDVRSSSSAAWVLTQDAPDVIGPLVELAERDAAARGWAISVLGRRRPEQVSPFLEAKPNLLALVSPWWVVAPGRNWSSTPAGAELLEQLGRQVLVQRT